MVIPKEFMLRLILWYVFLSPIRLGYDSYTIYHEGQFFVYVGSPPV